MDTGEYLKRYFEQVKDKPPTATTIKDAVASASTEEPPAAALESILAHAEAHGINPGKELAELNNARAAAQAAKADNDRRASIKTTIGKLADRITSLSADIETSPLDDISARLAELNTEAAGLITTAKDRLGTWESFIDECITYEPEKDFRPELFNGLAFPPGTVSYIGSRAKVGKTTAMINLCREALFNNRRVFLITLEMSRKQLLTKLILCTVYSMAKGTSTEGELKTRGGFDRYEKTGRSPTRDFYDLMKAQKGKGTWPPNDNYSPGNDEFEKLVNRAIEIIMPKYQKELFIYDGRGAGFQEITAAIKAYATPETLVLLDYIQRMPPVDETGNTDTYMRVKKISDGVLNAAAVTGSIIISGAQFNRTVTKDHAGNEVIVLTSFRESGDLEQDCHNAIGIGRMAEKGSRYIKMLAAREALVEDDAYSLDFAGAYSYMAKGEKIKAPEENTGNKSKTDIKKEPITENDEYERANKHKWEGK